MHKPWRRWLLAVCALLGTAAMPAREARSAVRALDSAATIRINQNQAPAVLTAADFSLNLWLRPDSLPESGTAGIFELPGVVRIAADSAGTVHGSVHRSAAMPQAIALSVPDAFAPDEWSLVTLSFDRDSGQLVLSARREGSVRGDDAGTVAGFAPGPATAAASIGAGATDSAALVGLYGVICVRIHSMVDQDFEDLWTLRAFDGGYGLVNFDQPGTFAGAVGCAWMLNHTVAVKPKKGFPGPVPALPALIGEPVTNESYASFRVGQNDPGLQRAYGLVEAQGFVYASVHDAAGGDFFVRAVPGTGVPVGPVSRPSPAIAMLAAGVAPQGLRTVMVTGNSRAVRRREQTDGPDGYQIGREWPGNFVGGFWDKYEHMLAGVAFIPADDRPSAWMGFSTFDDLPRKSGVLKDIRGADEPVTDFSRFFTGSLDDQGRGPGVGLFMLPGSSFTMKSRPDGLMAADAPLLVRVHAMAFPGSSALTWRSAKEERQSGGSEVLGASPGVDVFSMELDTTRLIRVVDQNSTAIVNGAELRLAGDYRHLLFRGTACFVSSGIGAGGISLIDEVTYDADNNQTTATFELPFHTTPSIGSVLHLGPWGMRRLDMPWPALAPDDARVWRGARVECATDPTRPGAVIFAFSARNPEADGYIFGLGGWAGHGYGEQIDASFLRAHSAWMRETEADVWLQVLAHDSQPDKTGTSRYAQLIRTSLPGCEVAWLGDACQGDNTAISITRADWHQYLLDAAPQAGVLACTLLEHPGTGTYREQLGDGLRIDEGHVSHRGNRLFADLWMELLLEGGRTQGDADFDGDVDFADLNRVLFNWGEDTPGPMRDGDLNGDSFVDFADLNVVLTSYPGP